MTDREKLRAVADSFGCGIKETNTYLSFADRRYFFDRAGELTKIIDLRGRKRYTPEDK